MIRKKTRFIFWLVFKTAVYCLIKYKIKQFVILTCKTTIKNKIPHAISTLNLPITITQPPNCPNKLSITNNVAKN